MKPRIRSIRNLYFRWGRELGLEPEQCARVLEAEGLIELTPDRQHYKETGKALAIPSADYEWKIQDTLIFSMVDKGSKNGIN